MRPTSRLFGITAAWAIARTWWAVASRAERAGVLFCVAIAALFPTMVVFTGPARQRCFGMVADAERAFARSDAAIEHSAESDEAGRCAIYRERVRLLSQSGLAACLQPRIVGRERFNDPDVERRFYERLIAEKCIGLPDPSCSGPACASLPGG